MDEGTPAEIADCFEAAGFRAIRFHEVLSLGAKDDVVCAAAMVNSAALVAVDKDMKHFKKRFGQAEGGGKFTKMHLIHFSCSGVMAVKRSEQAMSFIEHEWLFVCQKTARSMWLDIGAHHVRSYR
jgi:hypothetical protein